MRVTATLNTYVASQPWAGIILCMGSANERMCYIATPSFIGWAHTQNDPWCVSIIHGGYFITIVYTPWLNWRARNKIDVDSTLTMDP